MIVYFLQDAYSEALHKEMIYFLQTMNEAARYIILALAVYIALKISTVSKRQKERMKREEERDAKDNNGNNPEQEPNRDDVS